MNSPVLHPEPRRIVERASVDLLIAEADRDVSRLEAEVVQARASAAEAEAQVGSREPDERGAAWLMLQVERFVQQLRADAEAEAANVVYEAQTRARAMAEEARLEVLAWYLDGVVPAPVADVVPAPDAVRLHEPAPAPAPAIDDLFALMTPDDFTDVEARAVAPLDDGFWPVEEPRRRRFRMSRPVALTQALALGLVAAAAVVHFA